MNYEQATMLYGMLLGCVITCFIFLAGWKIFIERWINKKIKIFVKDKTGEQK